MPLDVRTIIVLTAVSAVVLNLGLIATAGMSSGRVKGAGRWAAACGGEALGWVLLSLRGIVPDVVSMVVANTLLLLAAAIYLHALREFDGDAHKNSSRVVVPYALVVGAALALAYFTLVAPSLAGRIVVVSLVGAPLTLSCGRLLLCGPERPSAVRRAMGCGFLGCGLALLARIPYTLLAAGSGLRQGFLSPSMGQEAIYLGSYVALVVLTLGFLLLCNERLNRDALRLATRDALTGAHNRRAIEESARADLARCRRSGLPLAVLLVDLDHFKAINDTYGHATGDAALRVFVATATAHLRARDMLGRYGGEEFLVVLPATTREDALTTAERLRTAVAGAMLEAGEHRLRVTAVSASRRPPEMTTSTRCSRGPTPPSIKPKRRDATARRSPLPTQHTNAAISLGSGRRP